MKLDNIHIENKVVKSLNSLNGIKKAKAPDFFYTRLQARMEAEMLGKSNRFFWIGNLKLSATVLALVLVMNMLSLLLMDFPFGLSSNDAIDTLSGEYFSPTDNYYYLNNQE